MAVADLQRWPAGQAAAEWRAGWPLVLSATLGYSVIGMLIYALSAFLVPLQEEFGWPRTLITAGPTVYAATSLFCQPVVGWMVDRYGPRRLALTGVLLSAITCSMFGFADSVAGWLLMWFIYSLSIQLMLTPVWTAAVASEFDAGRGLALAVTLGGSVITGAVAPIAATMLIAHYNWRVAFVAIGLGVGAVVLTSTWFLFHSRADRQRPAKAGEAEPPPLTGVSLPESLRSPIFYKLFCGIFAGYVIPLALLVSMLPMLGENGIGKQQAAVVAACFGIAAFIGKVICGVLVNRFAGHLIAAVAVSLPIISYLILLVPGQPMLVLAVAVFLMGMSTGSQLNMIVYLTTRYFGMRAFGAIFGVLGLCLTAAGGLGPPLGGAMFDVFGSYRILLMLGVPMAVFGSLLLLWVGDYPEVREARRMAKAAA